MIRQTIIQLAKSFLGKEETPNNSGFKDPEFQKKMIAVGWQKGHPWCSYFAELVYKSAYEKVDATKLPVLDRHFSGSAVETFTRFKQAGWKTSMQPEPGDVVIWRHGSGWQGHAGIVTAVVGDAFQTIEGNTNPAGGREGIAVSAKTRKLKEPFAAKGLNLVGFIKPQ